MAHRAPDSETVKGGIVFVWNFVKWFGRVLLWIFLFPIGVWRSLRHGRRKTEKRILEAMREERAREGG